MPAEEAQNPAADNQSPTSSMSTVPENGIDISPDHDGGVIKVIKRHGSDDTSPRTGDNVFVHYVGTLTDGTKFDSSRDRGEEFNFTLGQGKVIKGWDIGVASMKKGELCELVCRSEYAYGEGGSPPKIPPNATLIFEVELLKWEGEDISPDKDKSITRSLLSEGDKWEKPNDAAIVNAHIVGRHAGRVFVDNDFKFPIGECTEQGLPEGVDKALKQFKKGETSIITLQPKWGYGKAGKADFGIPPQAALEFEIHLKDFEKAKESWQMNDDEKLSQADILKAQGTEFFQKGKYKLAVAKYKKIVDLLQYETTWQNEKKTRRDQLYIAAHLNLALCCLKGGDTVECVKHCDKVLADEKDNVKALYRRGQAYQQQNDFELATKDFAHVLELEAENKAAALGVQQCKQAIKAQNERDKKIYSNMFKPLPSSKVQANDNKTSGSEVNHQNTENCQPMETAKGS